MIHSYLDLSPLLDNCFYPQAGASSVGMNFWSFFNFVLPLVVVTSCFSGSQSFSSGRSNVWFSIFFLILVPLWFFVFSGVSVVVVFAPHPSLPFPLLFGGLLVVAEAEFGFVPALLCQFRPLV